jgi:hypothetical protein
MHSLRSCNWGSAVPCYISLICGARPCRMGKQVDMQVVRQCRLDLFLEGWCSLHPPGAQTSALLT